MSLCPGIHLNFLTRASRQIYMARDIPRCLNCQTLKIMNILQPTKTSVRIMGGRKPTRCHNMFYWTCNLLNMFRTHLCPSSGARDYTVWYVACNSWLVGRSGTGQQAMHSIPHLGRIACCSESDLPTTSNKDLHATCHTDSTVASSWWLV